MEPDYCVYFQEQNGNYRVLHKGECKTLSYSLFGKISRRYECFQGYTNDDKTVDDNTLERFNADFLIWNEQLKTNPIFQINWLNLYSNKIAVCNIFMYMLISQEGKNIWTKLKNQPIQKIEAQYIEDCFNGGITKLFVEPNSEDDYYECYGYDFTCFYPSMLASEKFHIPIKEGKEIYYDNIPTLPLPIGHYYCKITSTNPNFQKIFAFSPKNCYTHYCLTKALQYQKQFDVKIEMLTDREKNAYIYNKKDLITGNQLFYNHYTTLKKIKQIYPKNKLVKHLLSSLHGQLTAFNKKCVNVNEIDKCDMTEWETQDLIMNEDLQGYYSLRHQTQLYKYNIRIKSFLTAYGRSKIGEVALRDIDHVIAIQTDGIVFNSSQDFSDIPNLRHDDKTTGDFRWFNAKRSIRVE